MPNNHRFWAVAHEAGHATVAIAQGLIPAYALVGSDDAPEGGKVDLPMTRSTNFEQEFRFATSGAAGEIYVYRTEKDSLPMDQMVDAILNRARVDIAIFEMNIDRKSMGLDTDEKLKDAFLLHARQNSLRDIQANPAIYKVIRDHLERHRFMGKASLELAAKGLPATAETLRKDAEQRITIPS
ncbi:MULTISPECIES: hypothetical protein [Rhizobium]|uniref:hypothetical protein n=1 Tax=Rhizobium TaxID=379 RepID=UPI0004628228|nr:MULTISPECIES: hypothetical protein [Rhizobium]UFS81540.1 hypothetical protein LPB79_25040 [Rhizobium sp. T136]